MRDCGFCAQGRSSSAGDAMLSRVSWPRFGWNELLEALAQGESAFQRICIQATVGPDASRTLTDLVAAIRSRSDLPLDVSALPADERAADALIAAGVDHIGFGVDAATPDVFRRVKGAGWDRYQRLIAHVAARHPGRAAVHLIAGLGETESELLRAVQTYTDLGAVVGLFAFCPVVGTQLEHLPAPAMGSYRRVQAASYLITRRRVRLESLGFGSTGELCYLPDEAWVALAQGEPFRTSGCPGCNRPFYNERPGGPQYNYARPLSASEAATALAEMGIAPRLALPTL